MTCRLRRFFTARRTACVRPCRPDRMVIGECPPPMHRCYDWSQKYAAVLSIDRIPEERIYSMQRDAVSVTS